MPTDEPDRLFARGRITPGGFRFDAEVARVFSDMIARSVPGYAETVALTGWLAGRFGRDGTHLYDLGCSLGATLFACLRATEGRELHATGVDSSAPMLERCRERLAQLELPAQPELLEADVREVVFAPTSFVALNWTLQFVPVEDREGLLQRIHDALVPGGALVLSEKVLEADAAAQALLDRLHLDFKRAQGYSELEIAAKRSAIEDVLVPETIATHRARLARAGFATVTVVARTLNFATLLAVRA
ncbi:MAG: carboxy-S-adenosyl-L-methionine synthase CmoA [Pseudomonadales bacterium]|jgi:tRNA (cmo5U34)-methyltransferase|nr:carboxy-S-adenosyl-L-methionine synthase CmoA [Pseudomonadales bacterium]